MEFWDNISKVLDVITQSYLRESLIFTDYIKHFLDLMIHQIMILIMKSFALMKCVALSVSLGI